MLTNYPIFQVKDLSVQYNQILALKNINLEIYRHQIMSFIGRSGCGKSTLLRCFNRLNDLETGAKVTGTIFLEGQDIYSKSLNPVELRRRVGMVFQRPNPFPKSIYKNISIGLKVNGCKGDIDEIVEFCLKQVGLWDELKGNLRRNALTLSGGQQQRLCIARAIALQPEVILMDEPCSSLDPISTMQIENLLSELKNDYTIVIVTHNLKQAARISDYVAFFDVEFNEFGHRFGYLVECDRTEIIFQQPKERATIEYVTGGNLFKGDL